MIVESPEETFLSSSYQTPRHRGRAILFAGVAAACVLGAGLGLWARPAMQERRAAAAPPPDAVATPPAMARRLQIVVDDLPSPTAPIEAPRATGSARSAPPAPVPPAAAPPPQVFAPVRPAEGLIRAQAVSPPAAASRPLIPPGTMKAMVPAITGAIAATGMAIARAEAPPARFTSARVEPVKLVEVDSVAPPTPPHKARLTPSRTADAARLAKVQAAKRQLAKAQVAKAQAAKLQAAKVQLAKAEAARTRRLELAQAAKAKAEARAEAKAEKAEQVRLAQAEARGRAEARAEARQEALADARKRARLAALAHALARALPHREPAPPVEMAKLEHRRGHKGAREPKVEQALLKTRRSHEAARPMPAHSPRPHVDPVAPPPASGLMKVSATSRCANRDPGEAMVCADPSLGAADRQLARAYQGARAAGVPDAQLRSQQQRWLAARSAAAREAPWAVRDVYMARIAELNGQAKDAQGGY